LRERSVSRFSRGNPRQRKSFRAFADQHDVAGVLHHSFRNERNVLDVTDAAHRSGASRGPCMQQASSSTTPSSLEGRRVRRIVVGSSSGPLQRAEQRRACRRRFSGSESVVKVIDAVVGADDDRALGGPKGLSEAGFAEACAPPGGLSCALRPAHSNRWPAMQQLQN